MKFVSIAARVNIELLMWFEPAIKNHSLKSYREYNGEKVKE